MKDFEEEFLSDFDQNKSPYVYITKQVVEVIQEEILRTHAVFSFSMIAATALTAPFQTIATSLQLSVKPHKDLQSKYSPQAKSKQLAKLNKQMTIREKRNFELMVRSGAQNPYAAPVYLGYRQTINALLTQGWKSFFKGLHYRLMTTGVQLTALAMISVDFANFQLQKNQNLSFLQAFVTFIARDIFLNPLHVLENRNILQSGITEFKVFRKAWKDFYKILRLNEGFLGWKYYLLNNTVGFFTTIPILMQMIKSPFQISSESYLIFTLGETFLYPFQTAYKRIICQSKHFPLMIPERYSSVSHALKVIMFEQGVKGLWRGFGIYFVGILTKLYLVRLFLITNHLMNKHQKKL